VQCNIAGALRSLSMACAIIRQQTIRSLNIGNICWVLLARGRGFERNDLVLVLGGCRGSGIDSRLYQLAAEPQPLASPLNAGKLFRISALN
jgi:hypothetical protein